MGSVTRAVGIAILVVANGALLMPALRDFLVVGPDPILAIDYRTFSDISAATVAGASPFATHPGFFRWSPLMAYVWVPIAAMGLTAWRLLHLAVLPLLGDRRLAFAVLISAPFWADVQLGNLVTFAFVFAVMALRGSRVGTAAFFAIALLVPRPVMVPVAVWLLWHRPELRLPVAVAIVVSVLGAAATGYLPTWIGALVSSSGDMAHPFNLAPSRFIGAWWIVVGLPLAAFLTCKGRLGLASVAASPYWLPYYLMFGLLELARREVREPRLRVDPARIRPGVVQAPAARPVHER